MRREKRRKEEKERGKVQRVQHRAVDALAAVPDRIKHVRESLRRWVSPDRKGNINIRRGDRKEEDEEARHSA
jgi:hypothetical protein